MNQPHSSSCISPWEADREWEDAQKRVLLYLHLLKIPGIEALEIGLEALVRARRAVGREEAHPAVVAMKTLRGVLEERKMPPAPPLDQENRFGKICPWPELSKRAGVPPEARSMPLLNRGTMLPDRL